MGEATACRHPSVVSAFISTYKMYYVNYKVWRNVENSILHRGATRLNTLPCISLDLISSPNG
jgi:hypothetical protein